MSQLPSAANFPSPSMNTLAYWRIELLPHPCQKLPVSCPAHFTSCGASPFLASMLVAAFSHCPWQLFAMLSRALAYNLFENTVKMSDRLKPNLKRHFSDADLRVE